MDPILAYILKTNLALVLFYTGYYWWLRKLTFYQLNRSYLLFALVFSVSFPSLPLNALFTSQTAVVESVTIALDALPKLPTASTTDNTNLNWVYGMGIGSVVFALLFIIKLLRIGQIHFRSNRATIGNYRFRSIQEKITPFAFLKNIYLNPTLHEEHDLENILKHESIHVKQLHSVDIIISELVRIAFWYNPVAWLFTQSVRENIEFITDEAVLKLGVDRKNYQYSLLHSAHVNQSLPSLGNPFNFIHLKTRIMMMNKQKSSGLQLGKYTLIVPIAIAASLAFTLPEKSTTQAELITVPTAQTDTLRARTIKITASSNKPIEVTQKGGEPTIIVNGVKIDKDQVSQIKPENVQSVKVVADNDATSEFVAKDKTGTIVMVAKAENTSGTDVSGNRTIKISSQNKTVSSKNVSTDSLLIFVNGERVIGKDLSAYKPDDIESVTVLKGESAVSKHGEEAKKGVIEIILKER